MHYKILLALVVTVATLSFVASSCFGKCSSSNGGGNCHANPGQTQIGGFNNLTNQSPPVEASPAVENDPFGEFGTAVPPSLESGAGGQSSGLVNGILSGQSFDVIVEHPAGKADIKVRTFSLRQEADQFVDQLSQRFWVAFSDSSNQRGYREAKSAAEIAGIAAEIRTSGDQFRGAFPVIARVALPEATFLEGLLEGEQFAPVMPPAQQVIEEDQLPPEEPQTPLADSQLTAIEGLWAAVARSSNGELQTIELKLDSGGWASLTIPDGSGQSTTIERRAVVEDGQLKLRDGEQEMLLGNLVQVKPNQFVVTRDGGQITFLKK
jgi:hypothetical protein